MSNLVMSVTATSTVIAISLIVACITFCLVFLIYKIIANKQIKIVHQHSLMLKELIRLNTKTHFRVRIQPQYVFTEYCESKRAFDRLDNYNYLKIEIAKSEGFFEDIIAYVEFNKKLYKRYLAKCNYIKNNTPPINSKPYRISQKRFNAIETKLFSTHQLSPVLATEIISQAQYTSPEGRNHYEKKSIIDYETLVGLVESVHEEKAATIIHREHMKAERSKMTDSLRYDILRRDHFRCQICGATAQDGVKLHVDHIIPVSKGGKTEKSNLRTLCDKCNLGKRDKIENSESNEITK